MALAVALELLLHFVVPTVVGVCLMEANFWHGQRSAAKGHPYGHGSAVLRCDGQRLYDGLVETIPLRRKSR